MTKQKNTGKLDYQSGTLVTVTCQQKVKETKLYICLNDKSGGSKKPKD